MATVPDRMNPGTPRRRRWDKGWRWWLKWAWYNLVPLAAIALAAVAFGRTEGIAHRANDNARVAKMLSRTAQDNARVARRLSRQNRKLIVTQREGRRAAIRDACQADEVMAAVVRQVLANSLGRIALTNPQRSRELRRTYAGILRPLGGLDPLTRKQQDKRCDRRVRAGLAEGSG
jgi:hypothetical protein